MGKKIITKVFHNKKNKQMSVVIPKKAIKPTIKFGEELFVSIEFVKKGKK